MVTNREMQYMGAEKQPFQVAHEKLEEGKERMRHILALIEDGHPVQNESHGMNVDFVIDNLREAAGIMDDFDDVKAVELRAEAVKLRTFSKTLGDQMRAGGEGFKPKKAFQELADEILHLETMEL